MLQKVKASCLPWNALIEKHRLIEPPFCYTLSLSLLAVSFSGFVEAFSSVEEAEREIVDHEFLRLPRLCLLYTCMLVDG